MSPSNLPKPVVTQTGPVSPVLAQTTWWQVWQGPFQPVRVLLRALILLAVLASLSWADWRVNPDEWITTLGKFSLLLVGAWATMRGLRLLGLTPSQRWEHRWISALILFLLFAPDVPWWGFLILGVLTEAAQRIIRLPSGPLANPAALGGLLGALLLGKLGVLPTWWGVSFAPRWFVVSEGLSVASLLVLPVMGWIAWKYKKLVTATSLIAAAAVTYVLVFQWSPTFLIFEGTLLFFALVMAAEPKTSPVLPREQMIFGAGVGIVLVLLLKVYFVEAYLGALVLANIVYNGRRWWKMKQLRRQAVAKQSTVKQSTVPGSVRASGGTKSPLPAKG